MREVGVKTAMRASTGPGKLGPGYGNCAPKRGRMGSLDQAASASTHEVTRLLQAWGLGDDSALERISQETGRNKTLLAQETVITTLNRMMVGWANYFCLG